MTEKQVKEFQNIVHDAYEHDNETCIGEDGDYFIGRLSTHDTAIKIYLRQNFKRNDWADYC